MTELSDLQEDIEVKEATIQALYQELEWTELDCKALQGKIHEQEQEVDELYVERHFLNADQVQS